MSLSDWQRIYLFANSNRAHSRKHLVSHEPWTGALCGVEINRMSLSDTFPTDARVCPKCEEIARAA